MQTVVNDFNKFFAEKIELIRKNFSDEPDDLIQQSNVFHTGFKKLTEFELVTTEDIKLILNDTGFKTSSIDPIPSTLIEENIDFWLPIICDHVNTSLKTGSIDGAKLAHLSLDSSSMKNYRPISNLSFIGKLAERVVLKQLTEHLDAKNLNISYQSGYKKHPSTETLLVRIVNDTLVASDEGSVTIVMLLDLSAAFDTVDHQKLLHILKQEIGIDGIVLKWFTSFICGRCQKVKVSNFESCEIIIKFGVPKALSLGQSSSTFIYALYTVPFIH